MKLFKSTLLLLAVLCTVLSTQSCKDKCDNILCQNGGICNDGACDCPDGYNGDDCESFDPAQVQVLLDGGTTPKALYDGGVTLAQLYGKAYAGGIIFYLNTTDGTGMVAATEDQSGEVEWGCAETDILDLNNVPWNNGIPDGAGAEIGDGSNNTDKIVAANCMSTNGTDIAAKLCRDKGEEWFLPSIKELDLMYTNLHTNGHGGFAADFYWSSTEFGNSIAWDQFFSIDDLNVDAKYRSLHVRAAKAF